MRASAALGHLTQIRIRTAARRERHRLHGRRLNCRRILLHYGRCGCLYRDGRHRLRRTARLLAQDRLMKHCSEVISVHTLRGGFSDGRQGHGLHRLLRHCHLYCRLLYGYLRRRLRHRLRVLSQIAQTPLKLFDTLAQCPLEPLRVRNARLKAHTPIVSLAQKPFELCHMTSQPLDDGIRRLLEFFFQLLDRNGKILLVLFAALTAMDDEADDEQEDGAEYDERAEDFSNGNDDRTPPLSVCVRN